MPLPASSRRLRWLGLGLSTNLGANDQPHPYRLLDAHPGLFDFVEYSAPFDLGEARAQAPLFEELWSRREEVPAVYHPVHLNLFGPHLEPSEHLARMSEHAVQVGSPWVGNDVGWWHVGGEPFPGYLYLPPTLDEAGLADAVTHALHVQEAIDLPLLLENPATPASGPMHVLDFMARLQERTRLGVILDLGHLFAHQLAAGLRIDAGLDSFPLDAVIEIHLAGGLVSHAGGRPFYVDDHTQPVREELFGLLEQILPRCPNLRAVTFEGDGHPPAMALASLRRLRALVPSRREGTIELPPPSPSATPQLHGRPWELYELAYGSAPSSDPLLEADRAFRRAVLAQRIDRTFPITRLLCAATPEALTRFAGSEEFRSLFDGSGRRLPQVFAAWVRRELMRSPDEALSRVLSLETWAQALPPVPGAVAPGPGQVGLSPGLRVGTFAIDLSELVLAVPAVRRHVFDRGWGDGRVPLDGLDSLRQAAERAPPGRWPVAVRAGASTQIVPLDEPLLDVLRRAARAPAWEELVATVETAALREAFELGLVRRVAESAG